MGLQEYIEPIAKVAEIAGKEYSIEQVCSSSSSGSGSGSGSSRGSSRSSSSSSRSSSSSCLLYTSDAADE